MSAQSGVFDAFPLLRAAYMSQAAAIPPDLDTAAQMLSLANQGYRPAQTTIQAFLAAGNHPSAGAQNAGGVPDGMLSSRLRLIRGQLRRTALPGRRVGGRQPSRVPGVGPADRRVGRRWRAAGPGAGSGGVPGTGRVRDIAQLRRGRPQRRAADACSDFSDMEPAPHPGPVPCCRGCSHPDRGLASKRDG